MKMSNCVNKFTCSKLRLTLKNICCKLLKLQDQVNKCMWWMPWRLQAMKDAEVCEKLRGADKRALIRRCPNGETRSVKDQH